MPYHQETRYTLDDVTPEVTKAAKIMLDNQEFTLLLSTKLKSLAQEVLDSGGGDSLASAHAEYVALTAFLEWIETAAS